MNRRKICIQGGVVALGFLMSAAAMAGTAFAPQAQDSDPSGNEYPPSSFGSPPVNGISEGFAAREAIGMDAPDEESGRAPGRGLASVSSANSGITSGESAITMTQSSATQAGSQDIPPSVVSRRGVQEVSVIASDLGYFPKTIFVSRSVPVRMYVTSASKNTLCIMMDSFQVRKQIKSGKIEEITFIPNVPGQYRFYCPVNGMEGTMVVKEFSSPFQLSDEAQPAVQPQVQPQSSENSARVPAGRSVPSVRAQWESGSSTASAPAMDPSEGPSPGGGP